jgi:uncharacterized pyridoxamine 5'-phosphate oxidase family protein
VRMVRETEEDVHRLQELIERSFDRAGPHLRSIFRPERRLSALELVRTFTGPRQVAVATVSGRGEPRVAPVDAVLLRGRFHFGTSLAAARIRHLRARPSLSLTYFESDVLAVIVHGSGTVVEVGDPEFREIESAFLETYDGSPAGEQDPVAYVRVEPTAVFTFDRRHEVLEEHLASGGR